MDAIAKANLEIVKLDYHREGLSDELLLDLYGKLLLPRMIEEKMLKLLRQGKISKWFSGIGQEAIAVAAAAVLDRQEWIMPMHRNLGVFTTRGVALSKLFKQWQGKEGGYTKGRDRSFHFGSAEERIWGMISHLGPQLSIADGLSLGAKLKQEKRATIVFSGEGGTSEGEFHEALNVAAVWGLPVIFLIENNGYGLSTPVREQFAAEKLADRGIGYGMEACTIDGNNVLEMFRTLDGYVKSIRENPRPILVEAMTFRMRGHEEASGTKYVPNELLEAWADKDPVSNYERFLKGLGLLSDEGIEEIRAGFKEQINDGLKEASEADEVEVDLQKELGDVYKHYKPENVKPKTNRNTDKRFVDAISDGLRQSMKRYPNLILMGQDIADYGGVFKITEGFTEQFGKERVRNTPLCESAILGAALGLTAEGYKSMVEMQFADFVSCGFNQIVNNFAKIHYRWGQHADVVVRMPTGGGVGAGPFHSQSTEGWFFHVPGLKIVFPSNPADAKGLLTAAIEDPNPVLYFEHKYLYRSATGPVPDDYYTLPLGQAKVIQTGEDLSIITYGTGVQWAQKAAEAFPDSSIDILDLRTLLPYDKEAILASVTRTGKVIVLHEATLTGGIGGEIAAFISEQAFEFLDGPVMRIGALDTPVPFAKPLEEQFMPRERLKKAMEELLAY